MSDLKSENWANPKSVNLPSELRIAKFAEARIKEIAALAGFIAEPRQGALPSQQIPKHLRRRAVSHNPNRLPKRLRERHIKERAKSTGNEPPRPPKRPSRRYRRRPSNLLSEYNRRQRKVKWLETHIWHAKRFHMTPAATATPAAISKAEETAKTATCKVEGTSAQTATKPNSMSASKSEDSRWGYRLADYPNDKSFRANYRAVANKCLMQDISFLCCVELTGPENSLLGGLAQITGPAGKMGHSFDSPKCLNEQREGLAWIFHENKYPHGVIGEVSFLWKPVSDKSQFRTVWIWSHPGFYEEFLTLLKVVFSLREELRPSVREENDEPSKKKLKFSDPVLEQKLATKNISLDEIPVLRGRFLEQEMTATLLKDCLNRFRLVGPLTKTVLKNSLHLSKIAAEASDASATWWKDYSASRFLEKEETFWSNFDRLSQLPDGFAFGLIVRDPRKVLPPKRGCALMPSKESSTELPSEESIMNSTSNNNPIWDLEIRALVTSSKVPDHQINKMRSELLVAVSGKDQNGVLPFDPLESRVPVMLVHQRGSRDQELFGSGWDIIIPAGWAMPFWMNFVFQGARVGGLSDAKQLGLEMGRLSQLDDAPDSQAGKKEIQREKELLKAVYLSYPPDKRPNYQKMGCATPFEPTFSILVHDWSKKLDLKTVANPQNPANCKFFVTREPDKLGNWQRALLNLKTASELQVSKVDETTLLPIKVEIVGRGTVGPNSMICQPTQNDIEQYYEHFDRTKFSEPFSGPTEPVQPDECQKRRKTLKTSRNVVKRNDRKQFKALNQKLLAAKSNKLAQKMNPEKGPEYDDQALDENIKKLTDEMDDLKQRRQRNKEHFSERLSKLWVDDINDGSQNNFTPNVRNSSTREIVGFVTFGGTCFRKSKQVGLGFAPMIALKQVIISLLTEP